MTWLWETILKEAKEKDMLYFYIFFLYPNMVAQMQKSRDYKRILHTELSSLYSFDIQITDWIVQL